MRKLKLQVQISVDGFISGEHGEMDWMCFPWTNDIVEYVREITEPIGTIVLGRKLAEGFIPHWANVAQNPNDPEFEGGVKYAMTKKVVFSRTMQKSIWENTEVVNGDLAEEILKLKSQEGKDIIVYGGGNFVSSLIRFDLIDEFHLFINPIAIGKGMTIFQSLNKNRRLKLKMVKQFECGIAMIRYDAIS